MIHHMSIGAREPAGAARALAELLGGDVTPFGPPPGSFIAWARDDSGTAIDCMPLGTELRQGRGTTRPPSRAPSTRLPTPRSTPPSPSSAPKRRSGPWPSEKAGGQSAAPEDRSM